MLQGSSVSDSDFTSEAVKEFVRYMEMYPDVTVIFAMYSSAVNDFLKLDDGLRSRISRIVKFNDYSVDELCKITEYILREKGYELKGGMEIIMDYFKSEIQKENYGNARAARKLAEAIILCKALSRVSSKENADDKKDLYNDIDGDIVEQAVKKIRHDNSIMRCGYGMGFLQPVGKPDVSHSGDAKESIAL